MNSENPKLIVKQVVEYKVRMDWNDNTQSLEVEISKDNFYFSKSTVKLNYIHADAIQITESSVSDVIQTANFIEENLEKWGQIRKEIKRIRNEAEFIFTQHCINGDFKMVGAPRA